MAAKSATRYPGKLGETPFMKASYLANSEKGGDGVDDMNFTSSDVFGREI
jgi:hypothetical protein